MAWARLTKGVDWRTSLLIWRGSLESDPIVGTVERVAEARRDGGFSNNLVDRDRCDVFEGRC